MKRPPRPLPKRAGVVRARRTDRHGSVGRVTTPSLRSYPTPSRSRHWARASRKTGLQEDGAPEFVVRRRRLKREPGEHAKGVVVGGVGPQAIVVASRAIELRVE